ncbi:MAG: hypothetical protein AAGA80_16645 [Cyanobacteria bacterium P01_F01_bin.143]
MPTIEIISIGTETVPDLPRFNQFAYIVEPGVLSHRGLFQDVLDKETGIIIHLANKELEGEEDGGWFAGGLMEWNDTENEPVVFQSHRFIDVVDLLQKLVEISPKNELIFLTDYQFGPEARTIKKELLTILEFIDYHQQKKLTYNTLYRIRDTMHCDKN